MGTSWTYDRDLITIRFAADSVEEGNLKKTIEDLGYEVELAEKSAATPKTVMTVPLTKAIPKTLRTALERAAKSKNLLVVDFWASWCGPCVRLKKETLADPAVQALLAKTELVLIDLDAHPDLGEAWGVKSIPDVHFLTPQGRILDRLRGFEAPGPFRERLQRALSAVATRDGK